VCVSPCECVCLSLVCDSLSMCVCLSLSVCLSVILNEDKSRHNFKSSFTLDGCGVSTKPFLLDLSGPKDMAYQIHIIKDSLSVKGIPVKSNSPYKMGSYGQFDINGDCEMSLNWAKENHEGRFKLMGISCKTHEKIDPLTDLVLGGSFKGKGSSLDWDIDDTFLKSVKEQGQKALENSLRNEIGKQSDKAKKDLEKKAAEERKKQEDKLKDKAADKLKDLFK